MMKSRMRRREFLRAGGAALGGTWLGCREAQPPTDALDRELSARMEALHIPGLAACAVQGSEIVWTGEYGLANIDTAASMSVDTILNIASISKTVTTTALMQLWEEGAFRLDDDVSDYLSFELRHPGFPRAPVTFEHLLTHTSSIADANAYSRSYACGDPELPLREWIEEYFRTGGRFYDVEENFHSWGPGERYAYNNVAFGLVAHLVETISGSSFPKRCQARIFEPLGMNETSWYLRDIDPARHAVPYTWAEEGQARGPTWGGEAQGAIGIDGPSGASISESGFIANCLYNHPNYPDGFLRTSVRQLATYLSSYLGAGPPILEERTLDTMLRVRTERIWGLSWYVRDVAGGAYWGHGGADPGVNTRIDLDRRTGTGAIVFANTFIDDAASEMRALSARILRDVFN